MVDTHNPDEIVDRLSALPIFESVPRAELEWLKGCGATEEYPAGTLLRRFGDEIEDMTILLDGHLSLFAERGGGWRKIMGASAGQVIGLIPYSRLRLAPGNIVAEEETTAFVVHGRHMAGMVRECPELTAALVHHMVDRARDFRAVQLQDERMQSLGRLASGLAHELNNPASAATRGAQLLAALLDEAESASRALAAARLSDAELEAVDAVRAGCTGPARARSALEAADREDEIAEWLGRHAIDPVAAEALAATGIDVDVLERLASAVPPEALGVAIRWAASGSAARQVSRQIESATGRIHDLVGAVKSFTFMDREAVPEDVDVARGLADTLAMLEGKTRARAVEVSLESAPDLPRVHGFGSELNQVWEKLIDNAIDAAGSQGKVVITATSRAGAVMVRVADNGPGIPEEIRARIFDPFFTAKPVGQGSGLGLDLARRFVEMHNGSIEFVSQPGHTVFRVRLPASGAGTARGGHAAPAAGA